MRRFTESRVPSTRDEIWFLEHPPIFTLGLNGNPADLRHPVDIPVIRTDRGGQITWHGPGQLIAYTLLDKANIGYEKIDAEAQEDLTMKYGIRQAPTLIVTDDDGYESFVNLSNIKKFIEQC